MMNTRIILVLLLIAQVTFSQQRSRADRFFEKGDYINAALQYEEELNSEGYSKEVLERISESYYNTYQFKKAYRYLKYLTNGKFYNRDKSYDDRYDFMMYQVLSALGQYEKAIKVLAIYEKKVSGETIDMQEAVAIIEDFKLKDDDYTIAAMPFNSDAAEFGAVKKDNVIYFTTDRRPYSTLDKKYRWTHRPFLDIYKATVDEKNKSISEIEPISKEINSKLHEGNFCFTQDGNIMYLSKSNDEKGKKKFDSINNNAIHLYKVVKKDSLWGVPEKLPFNNVNYSIEHPSLSKDGTKLYFASNMPGGYGDFDIYYVTVNEDGTYGKPTNLGEVINTKHREQFPFISDEGHLFFSSNGHLGLGMMDIFASELRRGTLTRPINLGAPINSSFDDFSLNYHSTTQGFFASNRKEVGDDIYSFTQTGDIFPREYATRFEVRDFASDNYIPKADAVLYGDDNKIVYESQLDSIAGFDINIFPGKYNFKAKAKGYKTKTQGFLVKEKENGVYVLYLDRERKEKGEIQNDDTNTNKVTENNTATNQVNVTDIYTETKIKTEEISKPKLRETLLTDADGPPVIEKNGRLYFKMPPIYFDYDKWNIRADSKKVLDGLAAKLEKYKTVYIKISSHTDSRGSDTYNQTLSEKRAESTRNYLALEGYVNARRMKFVGFGESEPLIDCGSKGCTEEEHQTNRRSEFEIVKY